MSHFVFQFFLFCFDSSITFAFQPGLGEAIQIKVLFQIRERAADGHVQWQTLELLVFTVFGLAVNNRGFVVHGFAAEIHRTGAAHVGVGGFHQQVGILQYTVDDLGGAGHNVVTGGAEDGLLGEDQPAGSTGVLAQMRSG